MAENEPTRSVAADDLELLLATASQAGRLALRYYRAENRVWLKSGNSPVSQADIEVDDFLRGALLAARPDYGWLSEETEQTEARLTRERVFVVDPIDGTRGFLAGEPHWCICLSVVRQGRPETAVIHCPALERTFSAGLGLGARLNGTPIVNPASGEVRRVTGSRRLNLQLVEQFADRLDVMPFIPSLAYRIAMVANGELDGAFARPGAHDWDLAAGDLLLSELGGTIVTTDAETLRYNGRKLSKPSLIAAGPGRQAALLALAQSGRFLQ